MKEGETPIDKAIADRAVAAEAAGAGCNGASEVDGDATLRIRREVA